MKWNKEDMEFIEEYNKKYNWKYRFYGFLIKMVEKLNGFSKTLPVELFSGIQFEGKKRFYKKDKQGYYYIPEVKEE